MNGYFKIKQITKDILELLGVKYYSESYLKEMMKREYERGKKESTNVFYSEED